MTYSEETLGRIRELVGVITRNDMTNVKPDDDLSLDSIGRITLMTELENVFDMEISQDEMLPEMFQSLATIASFVEGTRQ